VIGAPQFDLSSPISCLQTPDICGSLDFSGLTVSLQRLLSTTPTSRPVRCTGHNERIGVVETPLFSGGGTSGTSVELPLLYTLGSCTARLYTCPEALNAEILSLWPRMRVGIMFDWTIRDLVQEAQ
jgi:hypothetical protein